MSIENLFKYICHDCGVDAGVYHCNVDGEEFDLCLDCIEEREDEDDFDTELEESDFRIKSLKENGI